MDLRRIVMSSRNNMINVSAPADDLALRPKYIYIACPWAPIGGGMFKVADYLVRFQSNPIDDGHAQLKPLDTRGEGSAVLSSVVLLRALIKVLIGRLKGELIGVHINMAERLSLVRKGVLLLFSKALGLPVVLHLHAAQLHHGYRDFPRFGKWMVRTIFRCSTACIVLGENSRRFVVDELNVPAEKVSIVLNGVPEPQHQRRTPHNGTPKNIVFLGNLMERKGVSDLLKALADKSLMSLNWKCSFAGGGDRGQYEALASNLGLASKVEFLGWVNSAGGDYLLANADILVLPSYDEGLPLVILEALAHGVAVICTPVGEIPHVLENEKTALFVTAGDQAALTTAIGRLLSDRTLSTRLEEGGQTLYRAQFSIQSFFDSVGHIHRRHFGRSAASEAAKQSS